MLSDKTAGSGGGKKVGVWMWEAMGGAVYGSTPVRLSLVEVDGPCPTEGLAKAVVWNTGTSHGGKTVMLPC